LIIGSSDWLLRGLNRANEMSGTLMLGGGAGGGHCGRTVIPPGGGVEKPMLGRYQLEKELGKGAMSVVYLGWDPDIGRVVAIKTMVFSQEFEPDELNSLGVARFQLACGRLPFQGDSMAQLLFKIANEAHADVRAHQPQLPACVAAVVSNALAKDLVDRNQDGGQMAKSPLLCLQSLSAHGAPAATAAVGTGA
jgi:serine/threonine protein kinase